MKGSKKKNRNANDRSTRTSSTKSVSTSAKKSGGAAVKEKRTRLTFQDRYKQLVEYHKIHGNCNVPIRFKEVAGLGKFVNNLREEYKKHGLNQKTSMTKERVDMLEAIGFNWGGTTTGSRVVGKSSD